MTLVLQQIQPHWKALQPFITIRNEDDYDRLILQMNELIDQVGTNEKHPMYEFLDTLGTILHAYEEKHYLLPNANGVDVLHFLMEEHGLRQTDLPEIGSQGVVSEILSGKRDLNVRQIRALAQLFGVSPAIFI